MFEFWRGRSAQRVDLDQCEAVGLNIELSRDRQERLAAKEILGEIDLALGRARQVHEVEGDTRNNAPAPSASKAVMIGVLTHKSRSVDAGPVRIVWRPPLGFIAPHLAREPHIALFNSGKFHPA